LLHFYMIIQNTQIQNKKINGVHGALLIVVLQKFDIKIKNGKNNLSSYK